MSEKSNIKSNSQSKRYPKGKKEISKLSNFSNIHHHDKNAKEKQKNENLKSKTPVKDENTKISPKINANNNSTIIRQTNTHYNINNNISINININMANNENKRHKSISSIQNKNGLKKNPISIKKNEIKDDISIIIKNKNNIKQTNKHAPIHNRIQSANITDSKQIKKSKPNVNKNNFSLTTTGFKPKKKEVNKNISIDNLKITENLNNNPEAKKDLTISITTAHTNNKKFFEKNLKLKKKIGKRDTFSPGVNREALNEKQNEILNYSAANRKIKKLNDESQFQIIQI